MGLMTGSSRRRPWHARAAIGIVEAEPEFHSF
jgi:hypothetical protein